MKQTEENKKMNLRYLPIIILSILLAAGALACGGGGSDPVSDDPTGQGPNDGIVLAGRILDREGNPVGTPWATVKLTDPNGGNLTPSMQPASSGPDAGAFRFINLPMGVPLTLEIGLFQLSIGRNLGYIHTVTLVSAGTYNLGDIVLENDFLDNGWNAYVSKDYTLALQNFNRAFHDRFIQADLTYSSSAFTGLGWVYAKRGKDNQGGLYYIDGDGNWIDTINSYEWDQAIINFNSAVSNPKDADAWVGMGGCYLTMLGDANKDPVMLGPFIPFYSIITWYFDEAEEALEKGLLADPNYNSSHDDITADDIRATLLFLNWIQGASVSVAEVNALKQTGELNTGSLQLLDVMPDLINYNPYPQL